MEYTLNTTMYAFDPGFQVDESYKPVLVIIQLISRFLLGIAVMLIGLFSFRVYIFWPTLIDRHKNNYTFSMVFFAITIFSIEYINSQTWLATTSTQWRTAGSW